MNYKVRVNNEAESKEVQLLGEKLGYVKPQPPSYISMKSGGYVCLGFNYDGAQEDLILLVGGFKESDMSDIKDYKELTISQLKDLVVLKRNSTDDATHIRGDGKKYFHAKSTDYFYQFSDDNEWLLSTWMNYQILPQLKPIEKKEMKEYLVPQDNGKYALTKSTEKRVSDWVEVPEGMNFAYKDEFNIHFTKLEMGYRDSVVAWQRQTETDYLMQGANGEYLKQSIAELKQPEELPFVDDANPIEFKGYNQWIGGHKLTDDKSLNDTYAEIEQVRQDALSIQVGGDHYKNLAIQPVEFAMQNNLDYCQANAIKYIVRHADKNGKEDLLKAKHYIDLLIQHHYTKEPN